MIALDRDACYRAILARDSRFDGSLFTAVKTTGIYCRPICPARTPRAENCDFYPSAAAAQSAGFRPCLRCRPELSPTLPAWRGTESTVSRALSLIAQGALDDEHTVDELASRLGMGDRQLRRLFAEHLGASPVAVAQTRRVLFAKQLLHDSSLSIAQVALASGYSSVRRFNEAFREGCAKSPTEVRRSVARSAATQATNAPTVTMKLSYRGELCWPSTLASLRTLSATYKDQGTIDGDEYRKPFMHHGAVAELRLSKLASHVMLEITTSSVAALHKVVSEVRRVLDLDADMQSIQRQLSQDPLLRPLIKRAPGRRLISPWKHLEGVDFFDPNAIDPHQADQFDPSNRALQAKTKLSKTALAERAERWRPWRAYAQLYLLSDIT